MSVTPPRKTSPARSKLTALLRQRQTLAPDLGPLLLLHRHDDGFVTFHKFAPDFKDVDAVRGSELSKFFPFLIPELDEGGLVSINAFYRPADRDGRTALLGKPLRRQEALRYLCACYVDLDIYKVQIDFREAFLAILEMQDGGTIPPPSAISRSGRGMWLFWFLRDRDDPQLPIQVTALQLAAYVSIQAAINKWFARLGADAGAKDPVRTTRVPGSLHVQAGRRVQWWLQCSGAEPFLYTLDELEKWFEVPQTTAPRKRIDRKS